MKKLFLILLILLTLRLCAPEVMAQDNPQQRKILEFLEREHILQKYDARLDKFPVMPKKLSEALLYAFPKHRFTHVELDAGLRSIVSIPADFILVSNADSGEIVGFISSTYRVASESFKNLLTVYQAKDKEDALNRVLILSELIAAYPWDDRVGRVFFKGSEIHAEVISTFEPYLILKVHVDSNLRFGRAKLFDVKKRKEGWDYPP